MYERSNEDGAMLGARESGFGLGTNGNVNVSADQPSSVRLAVPIRDAKGDLTSYGRMLLALRPAATPTATPGEGVTTVWSPSGGGFPSGGGGTPEQDPYAPGGDMAPEGMDVGNGERPAWLLPVLGLGGLAVVGTGVFLFARSRKKKAQRRREMGGL